jgi:hypothetical protein
MTRTLDKTLDLIDDIIDGESPYETQRLPP